MTQKFLRDDGSFVPLASSGSSASGPVTLLTKSTTADVALSNVATYFDGPSVSQGSSGTWFATGAVLILGNTGGNAIVDVRLWDGTNVIASAQANMAANFVTSVALSGIMAVPAGNLRISAKDVTSTTGIMLFNASGDSKDSTITAIRIG